MKIFVIIPHKIASQGYMMSQVVAQFSYLSSSGFKVLLLSVLDKAGERSERFEAELASSEIKGFFVERSGNVFWNYIKCAIKAVWIVKKERPVTVYAREVWGGLVCLLVMIMARGKISFVYDFRGAVSEETLFLDNGAKGWIKAIFFTCVERFIAKKADRLNAVTRNLSAHLLKKYGRVADTVIPCCSLSYEIDDERSASVRNSLGFSHLNKVYVYSGSLSKWQMFTETVLLFSKISVADPSARLLVLTPDKKKAEIAIKNKVRIGTYVVRTVRQDEIYSYLAACDFGFLLRENNIVNNVAFPIKFGEYISAGLAVITTEGASEIAEIVRKEKLGYIADIINMDVARVVKWSEGIMRHRNGIRGRAISYAQRRLHWSCYMDSFGILYGFKPCALPRE